MRDRYMMHSLKSIRNKYLPWILSKLGTFSRYVNGCASRCRCKSQGRVDQTLAAGVIAGGGVQYYQVIDAEHVGVWY